MFRIKVYLAAIGAFIAALLGAYFRGKSDAAGAENERKLDEYIETRRRMDQVDIGDADDARRWLRQRDKRDRDL